MGALFLAFAIAGVWILDLPLWLQIVLTIFGSVWAIEQLEDSIEKRD